MGIALSGTETGQVLEALQQAFMAADDIAGHTDVGQRARAIKEQLAIIESKLQAGRSNDRIEIVPVTHSGGVLVDSTEQWFARRVGGNNEIRATTEAYTREADAHRGGEGAFPDLAP